jgi:GxxExxY protein
MGTEEFNMKSMPASSKTPLSPFQCPIRLRHLARPEFDAMSREVMAHVFASQNELGCLCDEAVYQNDIALRLEAAGLGPVAKEVPVMVSLRDFTKTYYLDLVAQESFISELKTTITLTKEHDSQLLNYLLLTETPHGKLVNLRPRSVEYRTVNAVVSATERRLFTFATDHWRPQTPRCGLLAEVFAELLTVWGAFLDYHLYEEALIHFLGGESRVRQRVPLTRAGFSLGTQLIMLVTDSIAFRVTALAPEARNGYEAQLRRFLALTPLTALHWLNLHHHEVQLVTLTR